MTNKIVDDAALETFRQIVADAVNEYYDAGGDPLTMIEELLGCVSTIISKAAPPGATRALIQLGALSCFNNFLTKDARL